MQLTMESEEVTLLRQVVDSAVDRLTFEIAHTDNRDYRLDLKSRRMRLRGVLERLGGPLEAPTRTMTG